MLAVSQSQADALEALTEEHGQLVTYTDKGGGQRSSLTVVADALINNTKTPTSFGGLVYTNIPNGSMIMIQLPRPAAKGATVVDASGKTHLVTDWSNLGPVYLLICRTQEA